MDAAHRFGAMTYFDEVRAVGLCGARGERLPSAIGFMDRPTVIVEYGAAGGYRTYDLPLTKGVLYH
jgi:7-keto-8-aminopelargonate synthetase-like enzyme